jgi:hypothetical protein
MHTDIVDTQLVAYLSLREALGFQMRAEKIILPEFVAYVKAQPNSGPIRAQMALEWACQASTHRGPSGAARRLSMARGVSPLPPGLGTRDRGPRSRPASHATTAETLPLHSYPDHGAVGGSSRQSSAWLLASSHV